MYINKEKCNECGLCIEACPVGAILQRDEQVYISGDCVNTLRCTASQICPKEAIERSERQEGTVRCINCPVGCEIKLGKMGECRMYVNDNGTIVRAVPLTTFESVKEVVGEECDEVIRHPLVTGIGAGFRHSGRTGQHRLIVQDKVHGVDVVTCVSECHFLYSGVVVKLDCEKYVGEEGADIFHKGKKVGMVTQEFYGAKTIYIGGANRLIGENGWLAAKLGADIANRKRVELKVKNGAKLEIQVGQKPVINGEVAERRRWCCGVTSAVFLFKDFLAGLIDEVVVIDRHNGGAFGTFEEKKTVYGTTIGKEWETTWGRITKSGIKYRGEIALGNIWYPYPGGTGLGMTKIESPLDIMESFDPQKLKPGFRLLITEPNADRIALFEFTDKGEFKEADIPAKLKQGIEEFKACCEPAKVSAYFMPCASGSARHAVVAPRKSLNLNQAIWDKKACITVGGAPTTVLVGGGVAFIVDVERVKPGSFYWTNHPAIVSPLEWTMKYQDFVDIGGNVGSVRPLREVLEETNSR